MLPLRGFQRARNRKSFMNLTHIVNTALKSFRQDVPDYVASGIVDLSTGMLLAIDTVDHHPREILDVVAAATADLF